MAVFQWQQSPNVGNTGSSKMSDPNLSETLCLEKPSDPAADYATLSFTLVARMRTGLSSDTMPSSSLQKSRAVLCIHGFGASLCQTTACLSFGWPPRCRDIRRFTKLSRFCDTQARTPDLQP